MGAWLGQVCCGHPTAHLGGSGGHAPPENFGNLDSLRAILRHSDSDLQFQNFLDRLIAVAMYTGYAMYCTSGVRYLESNTLFCKEACKLHF